MFVSSLLDWNFGWQGRCCYIICGSSHIICLPSFLTGGCLMTYLSVGFFLSLLQISLQHALYLLHHGMLEDANRNLSQAETWRYGEKSSSQEVLINLIQAYKGLLQYYAWSKKKMELSQLGEWMWVDFVWWWWDWLRGTEGWRARLIPRLPGLASSMWYGEQTFLLMEDSWSSFIIFLIHQKAFQT